MEDDDPRCLRPGEARTLLGGLPWRRAVVLSGQEGRLARAAAVPGYRPRVWPDRVARALREARPGLACLLVQARRELVLAEVRSRQLAQALAFRSDLAVIACGGPDVRARRFDADVVETELSRILASLKEMACRHTVVVSPFDWSASGQVAPAHRDRVRSRQRLLVERLAIVTLRHGALHIDLMKHQDADPGALWSPQPGRLNSRGHAVAAAAVVRTLASCPAS
ncbi:MULTISPECIES: GDSL-type esterase/lipase family protein [unclassified Streptomyces]|uniref:GDSL-type esterase/lipase family protein n=1 Tax=unclassified Streptomyces TaxID=2593676 RepID=UPI0033F83DB5